MSNLKEITTHINNAVSQALVKENNTLEKKMFSFLSAMLEMNEQGKMICESIRKLNEDVVYVVLNGIDIRNDERAFVTGINWSNISERIIEKKIGIAAIEGATLQKPLEEGRTILYASKTEKLQNKIEDAAYINEVWKEIWSSYLVLTKDAQKEGLFTLNHWLFNKVRNPMNIGFYWGKPIESEEAESTYFFLPPETLRKLSIDGTKNEDFCSIELPSDFSGQVAYDRALNEIKNYMDDMGQDDPGINNFTNIGFAIYHIIRSFGCWGGEAFYSIPVNLGFSGKQKIGILSICSKKPLSQKQAETWTLVAMKAIKDVISPDIDLFNEYVRQNKLIEATYGIGHLYGNAIKEMETPFSLLKSYLEKENFLANFYDKIFEKIDELEIGLGKFKKISTLLHMLSKALQAKSANIFERPGWHSQQPINLLQSIENLKKITIDNKKCNIECTPQSIVIEPFLSFNTITPAAFIYDNLLLEILVNCIKHLPSNVSECTMQVYMEEKDIVFSNVTTGKETGKVEINETNSSGAILYFAFLFRETHIGNIYRQIEKKGEALFFKIILELYGITIK